PWSLSTASRERQRPERPTPQSLIAIPSAPVADAPGSPLTALRALGRGRRRASHRPPLPLLLRDSNKSANKRDTGERSGRDEVLPVPEDKLVAHVTTGAS